ncbi:MAG: class I SAM-dependent methyltransferase [Candidatus Magasanikbacteria bacterium]|nr:class I SAM-dependent methyltransferase [Candidatus Magasanikbacteria bacterium]
MGNGADALVRPGQVADAIVDESSGKHEVLAAAVKTSREDTSLAIQYSLLAGAQATALERRWWPYLIAWLPMMILSAWLAVKVWWYRLVIRPADKERWLLGPEEATVWFDRAHPYGKRVRNGVTTSVALDVIYSIGSAICQPRTWGERLMRFWLDQPDGQAVRNRLRITYREFLAELERLWNSGKGHSSEAPIRILSLACGSAQAIIEGSAEFRRRHPGVHLRLKLVDLNEPSLRRAAFLAQNRGVADMVVVTDNLKKFVRAVRVTGEQWDVVEMVGFLDYRPRRSLLKLCGEIRELLVGGGLFITAHIHPSLWSFEVRWVINWPLLIRRWPGTFRRLLRQAGFPADRTRFILEPNRIYTVALCRRATS